MFVEIIFQVMQPEDVSEPECNMTFIHLNIGFRLNVNEIRKPLVVY